MFQIKYDLTVVVFWKQNPTQIAKNANIEENHTGKKMQRPNEASLEVQTLIKFDPH